MNWLGNILTKKKPMYGIATWTEGGKTTKCGMPWSYNNQMTVAVGAKSKFKCGQVLLVKNLSIEKPKELLVMVVDEVKEFAPTKINLHKEAFEALGSPASVGIIEVEITPIS
ncbi:RlpA-like double-psi beta-barrel domain-containing protein [Bacillus timonensis]|nr:RlpA-like double-psi beta-barrel domain-containing protein [Bacillus timonensis]